MQTKVIYPNVDIRYAKFKRENGRMMHLFVFETWLRKKKSWGKYYFQHFRSECELKNLHEVTEHLNHFHAGIYRSLILGKVDLRLVFPQHFGPDLPAFEADPDQTPEEERLMPKI